MTKALRCFSTLRKFDYENHDHSEDDVDPIVAHPSSEGNGVVLKTDETGYLLFT